MNNQNLKPFNTWDAEAHRAVSSKAGIASGKSRRRQAFMREYLYALSEALHEQETIKRQEYRAHRAAQRAEQRRRAKERDMQAAGDTQAAAIRKGTP